MIFVTGGTGLVGSHLLLQLIDQGKKVRALKRSTSNTRAVEAFFKRNKAQEIFHKIEWIDGDILDVTFLPQALQGVETIIHTAAHVSFNEAEENQIIATNVNGTEALVNEAIESGVKEFIYLSSIAAMDDVNPVTKCIDESSTWNTEAKHSAYAFSKYRAEMEVWRGSQEGLNVIVLNPSVIIGSFDGKRESERIFEDHLINQYAPSGGTGFVDVRDVVSILCKTLENKLFQQKFIINAENLPYEEVLKLIAEKKQKEIQKISNPTLKVIQVASQINQLFGGQTLNHATYKALTTFTKYDNRKVIQALDYTFIPIKEAIHYHYKNYQEIISSK
ncbi:MAG TPA: NAD-dependent epimerase/dehydratase family protein [Faecalibacter sp.]